MPNTTADLKKFAQAARRQLREQVAGRLEQVLRTDSAALREKETALRELRQAIAQSSSQAVIDRVAYTWFNRLCALRFMDANHYTSIAVVSPAEGFSQPEILQEAKQGYIDDSLSDFLNRQTVFDLLGGRRPSADPQQEAYRMLLVAVCNAYNAIMPFLFEPIEDYTELLMPLDLLSDSAVLHDLRETLTPEACQDVEVIGWLYQYYISERKDEVFEALKRNQKIEAPDIPAATQLFTPHWIVRYLVENSLGRLWLLNHPSSTLAEQMEYYIPPAQPESDFLRIGSPEEIKLCDPACGSGHMLTYAFDLLYAIYAEQGYPAAEIPGLILKNNLYGIEIDERAGALAAFALLMKARSKDRRFFNRAAQPRICVLEDIHFSDQELEEYTRAAGQDLFSAPLRETLKQFEQAKNFGSLIRPVLTDTAFVRQMLAEKNLAGDLFLHDIHERVEKVLTQTEYLSSRYHIVVANPPYMGFGGMHTDYRLFATSQYPDSKSDSCTMFIERNLLLSLPKALIGMITIPSWMFLVTFEDLRIKLLNKATIVSLIYNGRGVWGSDFGSVCFILKNYLDINYSGQFKKLYKKQGEVNSNEILKTRILNNSDFPIFKASSRKFSVIPGSRFAFWLQNLEIFKKRYISDYFVSGGRTKTHDDERFIRFFWEIPMSSDHWPMYLSGGEYRKFYGNEDHVVNWSLEARNYYTEHGGLYDRQYWGKEGITWTKSSAIVSGFRVKQDIGHSSGNSPVIFSDTFSYDNKVLAFLNSKVASYLINIYNPTFSTQLGDVMSLPYFPDGIDNKIGENADQCVKISKFDWNMFETSKDFERSPLLNLHSDLKTLEKQFSNWRNYCNQMIQDTRVIEEENNRILISAYNMEDEITSEVPLNEITLTCNPYYRYPDSKRKIYSNAERETLLLADTMREFISYAVGCMFGRYSLDKPGLILANQGETLQDYLRQVPNPSFMPDEDNAIPILDGDWFSDDITERFKKFLRVTFGEEHYPENLAFIENAIGRDIRGYFLKEFYAQHVKMYQKRPIYWLFSSPQGSFNVLIYMQRYTKDTLSVILNRYLREFRGKLEARKSYLEQISISASANPREKTGALKEMEGLNKKLEELRVYERDTLFPLAAQRIEIDLDDGVKVNYARFGAALAKIAGL